MFEGSIGIRCTQKTQHKFIGWAQNAKSEENSVRQNLTRTASGCSRRALAQATEWRTPSPIRPESKTCSHMQTRSVPGCSNRPEEP